MTIPKDIFTRNVSYNKNIKIPYQQPKSFLPKNPKKSAFLQVQVAAIDL